MDNDQPHFSSAMQARLARLEGQYEKAMNLDQSIYQAVLGTKPDKVLANELNVRVSYVKRKREELGIKQFKPTYSTSIIVWDQEKIDMLGNYYDSDIALKLGNVDPAIIKKQRILLGIPPYETRLRENRYKSINWTEEMLSMLGSRTDEYLAKKLKLDVWIVTRKRQETGVALKANYLLSHLDNEQEK